MRPNSGGGRRMLPWIDASNGRGPRSTLQLVVGGTAAFAAVAAAVVLLVSLKWLKKSRAAVPANETPAVPANETPAVDEEAQPLLPQGTPRSDGPAVEPAETAAEPAAEAASEGADALRQEARWLRLTPPGSSKKEQKSLGGPTPAAKDDGEASGSGSKEEEPKS